MMQIERKHIFAAAIVLLIVIFVGISMSGSRAKPQQESSIKFERCDNTSATVGDFKLTNCDGNGCKLERGKDVKVTLNFTADKPFHMVHAHIDITGHSWAFNACRPGLSCPSAAWQRQSYVKTINIPEGLAPIEHDTVTFYMYNIESYQRLICLEFPVEIV